MRKHLVYDEVTAWNPEMRGRDTIVSRLESALAAAKRLSPGVDVPASERDDVVAIFETLKDVRGRMLPHVDGWCVVKHYHGHVPGGPWAPAVWCAHITEPQARAFAKAIGDHYEALARRSNWNIDRYVVEFRSAELTRFINPDLSAADYVKTLA